MKNIYNAVTDCLDDLELDDVLLSFVDEIRTDCYRVTFQERRNGNNKVVLEVEYFRGSTDTSDVLNDANWIEWVDVAIIERDGMRRSTAELLSENLAIHIDPDHFDSEDEEDDDDSTISQPLTPLPSRVQQVQA